MKLRLPLFALALSLFLLGPTMAFAGDWKLEGWVKRKSTWAGFGVGTVIQRRSTDEMAMPGMPGGGRKTVQETRKTLLEVTPTDYVLKVEKRVNGKWIASEEKEPKVAGKGAAEVKIEEAGEENLTVEGTSYSCKKRKVSDLSALLGELAKGAPGRKGRAGMGMPSKASGMIWENEKQGILKTEIHVTAMGRAMKVTLLVTRLKVSQKVGETTLRCRETTMTNSMMPGKTLMLQSAQVPERTVRTTRNVQMGPARVKHLDELVAFTRKAPAPTTGK